eukprot:GEMP01060903.1.p1 GENE.GEMP01060903.1~~GEMP01060903.1.p1  ORF type:complete len:123 (+),score=1.87 GEMP01060903.1:935-1303(+)
MQYTVVFGFLRRNGGVVLISGPACVLFFVTTSGKKYEHLEAVLRNSKHKHTDDFSATAFQDIYRNCFVIFKHCICCFNMMHRGGGGQQKKRRKTRSQISSIRASCDFRMLCVFSGNRRNTGG